MKRARVIISGGGTGGHLYPALVVGRTLAALDPAIELTYVGTGREVEGRIMASHGVSFIPMRIEGLKSRGLKTVRGLFILPLSFVQALGILLRIRPSLVIGVGGYSSGPIVLLASWLRVPTLILEQNVRPGFTNRLLVRWVRRAVAAFPSTLPYLRGKGVVLGNPVREEFYRLPAKTRGPVLEVLVFGGSQGSHVLNTRVVEALPLLAAAGDRIRLTHQTGTADLEAVAAAYKAGGFARAEVAAYIPDMPAYFGRADLVVCRAGATTLAELIAARKAAILVPFAGAAEDHQTFNARELAAAGAAVVLTEAEATPAALADLILRFAGDPKEIEALERNIAGLQPEDPAGRIARLCLSLLERPAKETAS
ncbi:MAG TPA: undecaprenyldiphospho-muramoylpentapeptide beta-N-acetylglucosaminyltransferase [Candidatus Aminicenantes bacterium]|nr:undecaprenyldiphospho-muramoylpentapeptide beta-N-acetylglucosaminyltransferase [Candidatus Aminicenantes bacterium]HRY65074.1 undecaprenyldiphospho-muramoylpentapeptide beta-N-acetylglucosaminyltransferase [Candidatus Aminicenantes bacterium]HRZ71987.1 undecaprenyldiphospho-muramoylpentapeptide beta-N-acetylglucosaminyltransferase [Candidatus Aminicenantes bacterium]